MIELHLFGKDTCLHHIGIGVKSIKDVSPASIIVADPIQKVSVTFVQIGGVRIELIEPLDKDSPISKRLKENVKLLHICYSVTDLNTSIAECRKHGFRCIARPVPAIAFNDKKIAWVYSTQYGLIELLENPNEL